MNYELARRLQDAGLPQVQKEGRFTAFVEQGNYVEAKDAIYVPTLEELIEACGKNKPTLRPWNVFEWLASVPHPDGSRQLLQGVGSTPTEAVARLWLALNKKV